MLLNPRAGLSYTLGFITKPRELGFKTSSCSLELGFFQKLPDVKRVDTWKLVRFYIKFGQIRMLSRIHVSGSALEFLWPLVQICPQGSGLTWTVDAVVVDLMWK